MSDSGSSRPLLERLFGGGARRPVEPGRPFVGTGLEALAALARSTGARSVVGESLAGAPALAGALGGGLATALGLALGGERVALFLADDELAADAALAREAVRRRVPLCLCLASGTLAGARRAAEAGMAVLLPATVGEAVDHAVAAHLAAEAALVPVVVALDGPTIAFALQVAALPEASLLERLLGRPADSVHTSGVAEHDLFGDHRRRIPRWHDATRTLRLGGELGPQAERAALAAEQIFFGRDLARHLDAALANVAESTGRPLPAVVGPGKSRFDVGLVASGAFAETARALAAAPGRQGPRLGVLALRRLAPLPEAELAALAGGGRRLAVLERLDNATGAAGVLAGTVHELLTRSGAEVASIGVVGEGAALVASDLAAACRALVERFRPRLLLGLKAAAGEAYPKRRALHDRLRRELPGFDDLAASGDAAIDLRPAGAVVVRFSRLSGDGALARDAGRLLATALGGHLHSRMELAAPAAGLPERDWLVWAPEPFADPGDLDAPATADLDLRFVRLPEDGARSLLLGALVALVARRAGVELKERVLRTAGAELLRGASDELLEAQFADLLAGFTEPEIVVAPFLAGGAAPLGVATPPHLAATDADGSALGDGARFWDQIGLPIGEGAGDELLPDPTLTLGALPAGSSPVGAAELGGRPIFEPGLCTGCAACWTLCSHGAIAVGAQPIVQLLEAGITAVGRTGASAEVLRRFVRKLAERLAFEAATRHGGRLGDWLSSAGGAVFAAAALTSERLVEARAALALVASEIGALPVAATPGLYFSGTGTALPDGALLTLAIDPDRCTGCGVCIAECAPGALVSASQPGSGDLAAERATIAALRQLPPSDAAAVERVAGDPGLGALAAALLSPEGVAPLAGFDRALPGSAPRLAVRQAFALLARALAPQRAARLAELRTLGERLAEAVHATLGKALPDRDLAALAQGLESAGGGAADLGELATRLAGAVESEKVDVARLGHLVEAARAVADLAARLGERDAAERPLFSVVVGPGEALAWARRFPDNPFGVPTTVASRAPLALARGLALAEAERAVAAARVLRRARLELERPQEALLAPERLAALAWEELDADERSLAVPLVVLVDEAAGSGEAGVACALVAGNLPVAVMSLDPANGAGPRSAWWAVAATAEEGIVAHASIAALPEAGGSAVNAGMAPLAEAWAAFAAGGRGAIVRLLAPGALPESASGSRIEPAVVYVLDRARRAVEAREFPLGCRIAVAPSTPTALRVDPFAAGAARDAAHEAELAAPEARHRGELAALERELRLRLAERARARLLELVAQRSALAAADPAGSGSERMPEAT
jgi:pyruvate/2-oxoacid:ferredoxin oxidoreductase alpha subunit/ferredoxin